MTIHTVMTVTSNNTVRKVNSQSCTELDATMSAVTEMVVVPSPSQDKVRMLSIVLKYVDVAINLYTLLNRTMWQYLVCVHRSQLLHRK